MEVTNNTKLYIVQFGQPDSGDGWVSIGGRGSATFYVLANDYGNACLKAEEAYIQHLEKQPLLDFDGSLSYLTKQQNEAPIGIKSIKLACEKIIF